MAPYSLVNIRVKHYKKSTIERYIVKKLYDINKLAFEWNNLNVLWFSNWFMAEAQGRDVH